MTSQTIRASGKRSAPVVRRASKDDPGVVKLIDTLNDELIKQRRGRHARAGSARREASPGDIANPERCACGHGDLPCPSRIYRSVALVHYTAIRLPVDLLRAEWPTRPLSTPNLTCAATSLGAPSAAWTHWPETPGIADVRAPARLVTRVGAMNFAVVARRLCGRC